MIITVLLIFCEYFLQFYSVVFFLCARQCSIVYEQLYG